MQDEKIVIHNTNIDNNSHPSYQEVQSHGHNSRSCLVGKVVVAWLHSVPLQNSKQNLEGSC